MRLLSSISRYSALAAVLATASISPASAQSLHSAGHQSQSLLMVEAANVVLMLIICCRLIVLRRRSAMNGS